MRIKDNSRKAIEGNFRVWKKKKSDTEWTQIVNEHNLVVNYASVILRDLMMDLDNKVITKIKFGDMNLTEDDDLINVPEPEVTDMDMINTIYEMPIVATSITYDGAPAIQYTAELDENTLTGAIITEYGLFNNSNELFAKKNRASIYKDDETALRFTWTIIFN